MRWFELGAIAAAAITPIHAEGQTALRDEPTTVFIDSVAASTTSVWSAAFVLKGLTYSPPRLVYLDLPAGHPGRGSGYAYPVGLIVDLGDMRGLEQVLGPEARGVEALILAHEVGHHVQRLLSLASGRNGPDPGPARELQADCYAGWWFAHDAAENRLGGREMVGSKSRLRLALSKSLQVLDALESRTFSLRRAEAPSDHGGFEQRLDAIQRGYAEADPWRC